MKNQLTTKSIFVLIFFASSCLLAALFVSKKAITQTELSERPASDFCQAPIDFDVNISCANSTFVARNLSDLNSYSNDYGLEERGYQNLRIAFDVSGEELQVHSPCQVTSSSSQIISSKNVCITAKEGVILNKDTTINSEKIHIISRGDIRLKRNSVIKAEEIEFFTEKSFLSTLNIRIEALENLKIVSTGNREGNKIRFGLRDLIKAKNATIRGYSRVNFSNSVLDVSSALIIKSIGSMAFNQVFFHQASEVNAGSIDINSGNILGVNRASTLTSRGNFHAEAVGCDIHRRSSLSAFTTSGSCLVQSLVNIVPTPVIVALPLSGETPLEVSFSAASSSDSDGSIESYTWTFPDGSTEEGETIIRTFQDAGLYIVKLSIRDNVGALNETSINIQAINTIISPIARFTYSPTNGDAPLTVNLDGTTSSDPDGSVTGYEWIFSDGVTLTGQTTSRLFETAGTFGVSLRVTDDDGVSDQSQPSQIVVREPNLPPVMVGDQTFEAEENKPLTLSLNGAVDPESNFLTYEIVSAPSLGVLSECLAGTNDIQCVFTPETDFVGEVSFTYKANDGARDSTTNSIVTIKVISSNRRPIANAGSAIVGEVGDFVTLDASGSSDSEGNSLTYLWRVVSKPTESTFLLSTPNTATPSFIPDVDGAYTIELVVSDGELDSAPSQVVVTVSGGENIAPSLQAISSKTVSLGSELRFTVVGFDLNPTDTLTFSARNLPENARFNGGTRQFRFSPDNLQVGTHTVTFMVSDGKDTDTQDVTITVEAPALGQTTTLRSRVIDATSFSTDGSLVGLAGVTVSVEGHTGSTTSDANGYFTLSDLPHGAQSVFLNASGITSTNTYGNFKGQIQLLENAINKPLRVYMLPRLDMSSAVQVDPGSDTLLRNTNIGVEMMIPAGTAMNNDGTPFRGTLSVSMVPRNATPRELPEEFSPGFIITLQPTNVRFTNPVPITFPNLDNFPASSVVELFSLTENGGFEKVGLGQVSSDRRTIKTISGGVMATTWHFPVPTAPKYDGLENDPDISPPPTDCPVGSSACIADGSFMEEHILPSFVDSGEDVSLRLVHKNVSSLTRAVFSPRFVYERVSTSIGGRRVRLNPVTPSKLSIAFEINGSRSQKVHFLSENRLGSNAEGSVATPRIPLPVEGLNTGFHEIDIMLNQSRGGSGRLVRTPIRLPVISPKTPFGSAWRLGEIPRIYSSGSGTDERVMIVFGEFQKKIFRANESGGFDAPPSEYSILTKLPDSIGGYSLRTKSGAGSVFNREGLLVGTRDRFNRAISYSYDHEQRLTSITHKSGRTTLFLYGWDGFIDSITDPASRVTLFEHDDRGNLIKITDPDGSVRRFNYNLQGFMISQVNKRGHRTNYSYDKLGNVSRVVRADLSTRAFISSDIQTMQDNEGTEDDPIPLMTSNPMAIYQDGNGNQTRFQTSSLGGITEVQDALGNSEYYDRDANNNTISLIDKNSNLARASFDSFGNVISGSDSLGTRTTFTYMQNPADNFHEPISVTDSQNRVATTEYNRFGQAIKHINFTGEVTNFLYVGAFLVSAISSQGGHGNQFARDENGNITRITNSTGQDYVSLRFDDVGNLLTQTDALGNTTTLAYDSMGRILTQTDAKGSVISYNYDSSGNLLSVSDQNGNATNFQYDSMNRLISRKDPLGRIELRAYDLAGNIKTSTDRNGNTTSFKYDALNRLTARILPDREIIRYTYDAVGNILSIQDGDSKVSYTYGKNNRRLTESTQGSLIQPNVSITSTYDIHGNRTRVIDSLTLAPNQINYDFNNKNQLIKLGHRSAQDTLFISLGFDKGNRVNKIRYGNQTVTDMTYASTRDNILSITHTNPVKTESPEISSFNYRYNNLDYVTRITNSRVGMTVNNTQNYVYDSLNQVASATKATGQGSETFVYDRAGNRLREGSEGTDSFFNSNNQLINNKRFSFSYDKNGNLLQKINLSSNKVTKLSWDYQDQLIKVEEFDSATATTPTKVITYAYDGLGRRIQKNIAGIITKYIYDGKNILLELDRINIIKAKYVHGSGTEQPLRMERNQSPYRNESFQKQYFYYHKDRLGNVTEITDFRGDIVQRYTYDAFGKPTVYDKDDNELDPKTSDRYLENPYTFTGREYDLETGNYYHRARYYDPDAGRFLSEESLRLDGPNLYWYSLNNPLNYIDPDGKFAQTFIYAVFFGVTGGICINRALKALYEDVENIRDPASDPNIADDGCRRAPTKKQCEESGDPIDRARRLQRDQCLRRKRVVRETVRQLIGCGLGKLLFPEPK